MPLHRFPSAHAAFAWAYEILDVWRAGSAIDPDPDRLGGGGTGAMGAVITALSIEVIADRHDPGIKRQGLKKDRSLSWFVLEFVSRQEPHQWSPSHRWILDAAKCGFCEELYRKGIAGKGECKGRCPERDKTTRDCT